MTSYQVTLKDRSTERIDDADAYQQEGQMTTFFRTGSGRHVVDTWSTPVASFRTSEVIVIRRLDPAVSRPDLASARPTWAAAPRSASDEPDQMSLVDPAPRADLRLPPLHHRGHRGLVRALHRLPPRAPADLGGEAREIEAVDYVPKMNVTPNAVALKD